MDQYAVFGHPIAHSRSPEIHAWFAAQTHQDLEYRAILAPLDDFEGCARAFFAAGGCGANVTVPFKLDALVFCDQLSQRARLAGAVNTLWKDAQGQIHGDNTDGIGLVRDITQQLGVSLAGKKVLLLGAGGAARGAIEPLLKAGVRHLTIANRTLSKAQQLITLFHGVESPAGRQACSWEGLAGEQFDLVVNATSASLQGELPPLPEGLLGPQSMAYDMMYAAQPTPFMRWAQQQGATRVADGLGMLIEQAAEAFFLWRGVRPPTAEIRSLLRRQL
ncbi:shikimate dehydrogenase [Marinospirillum sp. MEB164]|uniref:Shikimate dehydrogenase (NADP(+)) n=1 Tax=Marinospirillum alkalitolerans TaxID=3123374 RepID=A0ABW8PWR8_9GAMM